ncbi:putative nonstructural protein [Eel River basin pequenovirus]|nr:putative nonstructural protein [Eel River basin pequenovirus]
MMNLYVVYDQAVGMYMPPWIVRSDHEAHRALFECVSDPSHRFGAHPTDFRCYRVGSFDPNTGMVHPEDAPVFVVSCDQIANQIASGRTRELFTETPELEVVR